MNHIRKFAWILALAAAGCAAVAGPRVRESAGGEYVVEVRRSVSCDEIARQVYGDPGLGPAVAALSNLPPESDVPSGTLLVLPPRADLEEKVARERRAETLYREGMKAADAGSYREAADRFRGALRIKPERADILYNLGLALDRSGELEEATGVLEESARRRPDDPETRYALGSVLHKRGAYERALGEFQAVLRLDSGHSHAAFARARTLGNLGRTEDAERAWNDFLRRFPEDPWAARARQNLEELLEPDDDETTEP
jgi:tetratricopeptide (TPR) repeat protein